MTSTDGYDIKNSYVLLLSLRLIALALVMALMVMHLRSVRVFRWEQSVSGGVALTYCVVVLGLALCSGMGKACGIALQVYLCGTGATLLALNAAVIWRRWRQAGDITHAVAELLQSLGMPVMRHVTLKVCLSAAAAALLVIDLMFVPLLHRDIRLNHNVQENIGSRNDQS